MRYFPKKRRSSLSELMLREYGVPCPAWTSMQVFRYLAFGPRRKWVKIFQTRQNSLLELSGDLLWLTIADRPNVSHNVMKRILGTGQLMTLYTSSLFPRLKETEIYEIPDPVYRSSIAQEEYQPVLIGLRKGSVLTRHNLDTGRVYDMVNLGPSPTNTLAINYVADVLVIKSPRLFLASQSEHFFRFHVFQLHPFKHLVTFDIESGVFPSKEHRQEFGKLRNAEIHDGLLLVMTEKNFNLIYDAEKIIQDCVATQREVNKVLEVRPVSKVSQAPRLLFSTYAHLDILGLGGCPWTYIRALSDSVVEVRDMGSGELLGNGRVTWSDGGDQIAPDFLMFHPDDSSRVIHVRTQEIRILGIHLRNGNRVLEEEFIYPEKRKSSERGDGTRYSRSGRLTKPKFKLDDSLNRALSFNVETDMRVLVILEARRDGTLLMLQKRFSPWKTSDHGHKEVSSRLFHPRFHCGCEHDGQGVQPSEEVAGKEGEQSLVLFFSKLFPHPLLPQEPPLSSSAGENGIDFLRAAKDNTALSVQQQPTRALPKPSYHVAMPLVKPEPQPSVSRSSQLTHLDNLQTQLKSFISSSCPPAIVVKLAQAYVFSVSPHSGSKVSHEKSAVMAQSVVGNEFAPPRFPSHVEHRNRSLYSLVTVGGESHVGPTTPPSNSRPVLIHRCVQGRLRYILSASFNKWSLGRGRGRPSHQSSRTWGHSSGFPAVQKRSLEHSKVALFSDNSTALVYLAKEGGIHSVLS
ncbi:hypothetical protein O3P69_001793 [Scylla paramamosain]|uniref:Uncharacterized protein n=1 Tax=Scylla paramamosain TaxID=85552 RepID=A0AAW0V0E8_SCYPA